MMLSQLSAHFAFISPLGALRAAVMGESETKTGGATVDYSERLPNVT